MILSEMKLYPQREVILRDFHGRTYAYQREVFSSCFHGHTCLYENTVHLDDMDNEGG
jgi:hypothetical protein